jgi:hypothetical protein
MTWRSRLAQASGTSVLIGAWAASHASRVVAGEPRELEPVYAVAEGCPDRGGWAHALHTRLPEHLRKHPALGRLTIEVSRAPTGSDRARYTGELGSVDAPPSETRRVSGASCAEVVQALSLIAALELQRVAPTRAPTLSESADEPQQQGRSPTSPEDTATRASEADDPARLRVGAVAFALLQSASAPRWTADIGIGVSLQWRTENLQPWLMLGVYWGGDDVSVGERGGLARFDRWATHLVGCPLRFPRQTPLGMRPCASLDLGRISGQGLRVNDASESAALLASAGVDLRFEWSILERLELGALFGGVASLARPRFYFSPEITALEVAPGGLRGGASASLSF